VSDPETRPEPIAAPRSETRPEPREDPTDEVARRVAEEAEQRLGDIEHALARLDDGSYGHCEVCGRPIEPEHLAERPSARRCALHVSAKNAEN